MVRKYEGGLFTPALDLSARTIRLDPSGVFLAAAKDRVMKIYQVVEEKEVASLEFFHSVCLLAWSDPLRVICASNEGYVYVIDLAERGARVFLFQSQQCSPSGIDALRLASGHTVLAIAGSFTLEVFIQDPTSNLWRLALKVSEFPNDSDPTPVVGVHLIKKENTILMYSVYLDRGVRVWNVSHEPTMISEQSFINKIDCKKACVTPDGKIIAVFDGLDGFELFSVQGNGESLHISMAGSGRSPLVPMTFIHAGCLLAAGNVDGELRIWDVGDGTRLQNLRHDGEAIQDLTVSLPSFTTGLAFTKLKSALSLGDTPDGDRFTIATVAKSDHLESKIWVWRGVEVGE
ncbi:WD40-repeat-containing domain protein [Thelephora terrestris]|uniref:WD40-repeat-containing domain protein n=1 Tax=Thelephora terrestris TaxID=56493 RepID=A0A9P6H777_9AGAM|nr:WD40-repeat-containing domain protein [Thelephora terrestris]